MVTTATVKHPLQAGASPRALWCLLWALDNAPVITLLLVVPILGNRVGAGQSLAVPIAVLLVVGVLSPVLAPPVRRALRMRIPGALVPLSWDTDTGPSTMHLGAVAVTTLIVGGASVYGLSLAEQNTAIVVLGVGMLAGVSAGGFVRDAAVCLIDKLPGWKRELAICATASGARSLIFATAGLIADDHAGNVLGGMFLGVSIVVIFTAVRYLFAPTHLPPRSPSERRLSDVLLAHFTPAPTLADQQKARGVVKGAVVIAVPLAVGVLGLLWAGSALITG